MTAAWPVDDSVTDAEAGTSPYADAQIRLYGGSLAEGDVFSRLLRQPHVVRSLEFALANGALLCDGPSAGFGTNVSWAGRYAHFDSRSQRPGNWRFCRSTSRAGSARPPAKAAQQPRSSCRTWHFGSAYRDNNAGLSAARFAPLTEAVAERTARHPQLPEGNFGLSAAILGDQQTRFFVGAMDVCASLSGGLIIASRPEHPRGVFAFCRHKRDERDVAEWWTQHRPPLMPSDFAAGVLVVLLYFPASSKSYDMGGPLISSSQYRRLDSCTTSNLVVWNPCGPDEFGPRGHAIIPSEDIQPTARQVNLLTAPRPSKDTFGPRRTPLFQLLCTGLMASEYVIGGQGPLALEEQGWAQWSSSRLYGDIHCVLERTLAPDAFEHPPGLARAPRHYAHPVKDVLQALADQHALDGQQ